MKKSTLDAIKARALDGGATLEEQRTCALLYLQKSKGEIDQSPCEQCASKDAMIRFLTKEKSELELLVHLMNERLAKQREEMEAIRQSMLVGALARRLRR